MDPRNGRPLRRRERWLATLVVVGALGATGTWMTWASFSATATVGGNTVSAGTVTLADDRSAVPLYDVQGRDPGDPLDRCIEVTYLGSLPSDVRLYTTPIEAGDHVHLELSRGTGPSGSGDCAGFVPHGTVLFSGSLTAFAGTHASWGDGLVVAPPTPGAWSAGDAVSFRFRLEQLPTADAVETGPHAYVWEARNR
jgi:hypothetical protein